jgi:hypothetical protein
MYFIGRVVSITNSSSVPYLLYIHDDCTKFMRDNMCLELNWVYICEYTQLSYFHTSLSLSV